MSLSKNTAKQILFAHSGGAQNGPGQGSFDLVQQLRKDLGPSYHVRFPVIEDPEAPDYNMWKTMLDAEMQHTQQALILVGHSLGGSMLVKYLSEEKILSPLTSLHLVAAPMWGEPDWEMKEFMLKKNFSIHLPPLKKVFLYHSIKDKIVPFSHLALYKAAFPQAQTRELQGSDHVFDKGLKELTEDLEKV